MVVPCLPMQKSTTACSIPVLWRFLDWAARSALNNVTSVRRCTTVSLCFGMRKATPEKDVTLHSLGVSLSSACRDSCSSLRSLSIVGHSRFAWFELSAAPRLLQAAVFHFPIQSRYVPKLPWLQSVMALNKDISARQSSLGWISGRRMRVQLLVLLHSSCHAWRVSSLAAALMVRTWGWEQSRGTPDYRNNVKIGIAIYAASFWLIMRDVRVKSLTKRTRPVIKLRISPGLYRKHSD